MIEIVKEETQAALKDSCLSYAVMRLPSAGRKVLIAYSSYGLCYLGFGDDPASVKRRFPQVNLTPDRNDLAADKIEKAWLGDAAVNVHLIGTPFQISVWKVLGDIPLGRTVSYRDVARSIGNVKSARPVGSAVGRNPVSILIPCHRVLPCSGKTGQYLWGGSVKKQLLEIEGFYSFPKGK